MYVRHEFKALLALAAVMALQGLSSGQTDDSRTRPFVRFSSGIPTFTEQDPDDAVAPGQLPQMPSSPPLGSDLFRPIQDLRLDIREDPQSVPQSRAGDLLVRPTPPWADPEMPLHVFYWEAPNICYQPLYFEDVGLERYGETCHPRRQVIQSAFHFGTSFVTLPYHLMIDPPKRCESPYGYCRPGDLAPHTRSRFLYR